MKKIAIITDSTAYMPNALVEQYDVNVIPVKIHWDDETLVDGIDITHEQFYERLDRSKTIPSTSQPSAGDFLQLFEELSKTYEGIIAPLISTEVSGTVNSAVMALQSFSKIPIEIVNTRSTSGGMGIVVVETAKAIAAGKSLEEVRQVAEDVSNRVRVFFVVDTLKYLHMGGRIGGASRYFGTALNIKPILYLDETGRIDALEKVRTKKKAILRLIELAVQYADGRPVNAAVMHANAQQDATFIMDQLEAQLDCRSCDLYGISPGVGVHVGTGAVGLGVCPV